MVRMTGGSGNPGKVWLPAVFPAGLGLLQAAEVVAIAGLADWLAASHDSRPGSGRQAKLWRGAGSLDGVDATIGQ